ncbi:MAG TPA: tetraacyldisaccharide 4'-kinase [Coleofasciculaceae cyanobacterium]|jgi:tetraacyldisaccharide 4'-kinase/lipopolysaccharide heptosyltransferase II
MQLRDQIANLHYAADGVLSPWLWPLLPLAFFYRLGVQCRLLAYRWGWLKQHGSPVPVISIGNLTTGGTGKTPIVIELARGLIRSGKRVVVLSRGYGAPEPLAYGRATDPRHGDEAYLIQQEVPEAVVVVGRDRVQTLNQAIQEYHPDTVILDDGFQYLRLRRDINILLIDGQRLLGNGQLLPAGPLREPLSALKRANLVFITKQVTSETLKTVEGWVQRFGAQSGKLPAQVVPVAFQPIGLRQMNNRRTEILDAFHDRAVVAFSGIARPEQFEQDLNASGLTVLAHIRFTDHQVYTTVELARVFAELKRHQQAQPLLITTEKDLVKAGHLIPKEWQESTYILQVTPSLDGRWFHDEFLTQMPGYTRVGDSHVQSPAPAIKPRRRILVMRYRFIGDTLLTVPFLRNLRAAYPDAQIDMLVAPTSGEVLRDCPYIDELIMFDTTRKHRYESGDGKPRSFWSYARLLRQRRYDTAFVLKRSFSSAALAVLAGIPERVGFDTEGRGFLLTRRVPYQKGVHEVDSFLEVLQATGVPVRDRHLESWWQPAETEKAARLLSEEPTARHVVLHLSSSNRAKQWPEAHARTLAEWLLSRPDCHVHCLGAVSDTPQYEALRGQLPESLRERWHIHCGELNLLESMAFLKRMALVVGVDSGTLHMASAVGVPVVVLFGPMDERKWAPVDATILSNPVVCRPCNLDKPCRFGFQCMQELSPQTVIDEIKNHAGFA